MFVDDEPQILRAISRMLDCADVDWDFRTAPSGREAIDALQGACVDILVTDMRMPGMDGAELLDHVRRHHPETSRVILSGQADRDTMYRAVLPMHQFLSKPCDAQTLRDVLARTDSIRSTYGSRQAHRMVGEISSLPSTPGMLERIVAEVNSKHGSIQKVGGLLACDPGLTAKTLQLANSAMFGNNGSEFSATQAARAIGIEAMQALVSMLEYLTPIEIPQIAGFCFEQYVDHAQRVARIGCQIARLEGLNLQCQRESYTAGLLHDIGRLVSVSHVDSQPALVGAGSNSGGRHFWQPKPQISEVADDNLGGYLLGLWGLPHEIVQAVAHHRRPAECRTDHPTTAAVVCAADCIAHESFDPWSDAETEQCEALLAKLGLPGRLNAWRSAVTDKE
ncbi:HDOD domain-containing protein [Rosistilla ulvae]|nr:HDOD domain-containing protein [Rosistilla ulvae]